MHCTSICAYIDIEYNIADIDECREGTSDCDQTCINNDGNFTCDCHLGYMLDADSRSCILGN